MTSKQEKFAKAARNQLFGQGKPDDELKKASEGVDIEADQLSLSDLQSEPAPEKPAKQKKAPEKDTPKEKTYRLASCYLSPEDYRKYSALAKAKETTLSKLLGAAIQDYSKRIKLSEKEKALYDIHLKG